MKLFQIFSLTIILMLVSILHGRSSELATVSADPEQSFTKHLSGEFGKIVVRMETTRFNPLVHQITRKGRIGLIDNARPIGTDGSLSPFMQFKLFQIVWDKRRLPISQEFYASVYNAQLENKGRVKVTISDNRDALSLSFECGDATRAVVHMTICKDGRCYRFVSADGYE